MDRFRIEYPRARLLAHNCLGVACVQCGERMSRALQSKSRGAWARQPVTHTPKREDILVKLVLEPGQRVVRHLVPGSKADEKAE